MNPKPKKIEDTHSDYTHDDRNGRHLPTPPTSIPETETGIGIVIETGAGTGTGAIAVELQQPSTTQRDLSPLPPLRKRVRVVTDTVNEIVHANLDKRKERST
jgi:hypothetical protein